MTRQVVSDARAGAAIGAVLGTTVAVSSLAVLSTPAVGPVGLVLAVAWLPWAVVVGAPIGGVVGALGALLGPTLLSRAPGLRVGYWRCAGGFLGASMAALVILLWAWAYEGTDGWTDGEMWLTLGASILAAGTACGVVIGGRLHPLHSGDRGRPAG